MTYPIQTLLDIAYQASDEILRISKQDLGTEYKQDKSPVTLADKAASEILVERLSQLGPNLPVLSEEACNIDFSERQQWQRYWLVDPLDGTKSFIRGEDEYTVNIALIDKHQPVLGVIVVPATGQCYYGGSLLNGAFKAKRDQPPEPIQARTCPELPNVMSSRDHKGDWLNTFLTSLPKHELSFSASSIKLCLVAAGESDIYPRLAPTSEWDIAAGQAILEAAGGAVLTLAGEPLRYNTKEILLNPHFIAVGDSVFDWLMLFTDTDKAST